MLWRLALVDLLLIGMVLVWGINFSVVKGALSEIAPLPFNALRFALASIGMLAVARLTGNAPPIAPGDFRRLVGLGFLGNTIYQLCFIFGLYLSSAGNTALILAATPVCTAMLSALLRHEQVRARGWLGLFLTVLGVTLILRHSAGHNPGQASLLGDLLLICCSVCWSFYTVFSVPLLKHYPAIAFTAYTTTAGTLFFIPIAAPALFAQSWGDVSPKAWLALAYSFGAALVFGYSAWYYGVQRIGNTRTSVYSNMVPLVALLVAYFYLGEKIGPLQALGAAIIIIGVYTTRTSPVSLERKAPPVEKLSEWC